MIESVKNMMTLNLKCNLLENPLQVLGNKILLTFVKGEYGFPNLKLLYPKQYRKFRFRHLFKKATMDEKRQLTADLLNMELSSGKPDFFGLKFE